MTVIGVIAGSTIWWFALTTIVGIFHRHINTGVVAKHQPCIWSGGHVVWHRGAGRSRHAPCVIRVPCDQGNFFTRRRGARGDVECTSQATPRSPHEHLTIGVSGAFLGAAKFCEPALPFAARRLPTDNLPHIRHWAARRAAAAAGRSRCEFRVEIDGRGKFAARMIGADHGSRP